jgi:small GTP-binding protein
MSSANFAYDVFLSYSSKDKAVVHELATMLKDDKLRVWLDAWEICAGDNIPAQIEDGLDRSHVLVLCMSANAFAADWTALESQTFRFRDPLNKNRRFIPLRLDDTEPKGSLIQFSYVDWRQAGDETQYARLLQACQPKVTTETDEEAVRGGPPDEPIRFDTKPASEKHSGPDEPKFFGIRNEIPLAKCLHVLKGHNGTVCGVAISTDRRIVVSGSKDKSIRIWDVESGECTQILRGHTDSVREIVCGANGRIYSASDDKSIRIWNTITGDCIATLKGHRDAVFSIALSPDGECLVSGSKDRTMRVWDLEKNTCQAVLDYGKAWVNALVITPDGKTVVAGTEDGWITGWNIGKGAQTLSLGRHSMWVWGLALAANGSDLVSGSGDSTVGLWDLKSRRSVALLEGHTDKVSKVAISSDGLWAVSGSLDRTTRIWNLKAGAPAASLRGHAASVECVAISMDGELVISGSDDFEIRVWQLSREEQAWSSRGTSQYTNAKVLLVGESGSGKTGLTERLVHNRPPQRGPSTAGVWSTQWALGDLPQKPGSEREVWLWDFGGQADQRLIHQLYLDHTALVLLMFDSDRESVVPGLREWQQALARSTARSAPTLLVAGRTDVGLRFDREKVRAFAKENNYPFFETSSQTGSGVPELRKAMLEAIPWKELTRHNSPALFKRLKDEILKLRDEGRALMTLKELESTLHLRLPPEISFADTQLETVVSLLDGPGLVKELGFGTYVLLRPEWINVYAQAVIRTLRAAESGLGFLPVSSIVDGKLIFQTKQADGKEAEKRLPQAEEQIVLQAMEQLLLERRLCLRQNGDLVFPSHCGKERPIGPTPPHFFVSYTINGFLDDIYATLVVKLAHCGAFKLKDLWRDAADLETLAEGKIVGIKLVRREDGRGELLAHAKGISQQEQVIFASYIHEHLREKSTQEVPRLRFYSCPHCDEPIKNRELAMEILESKGDVAQIRCQRCDKFVSLWDAMEKKFATEVIKKKVEELRQQEQTELATRQQGKLLVLEVSSRITSANQKCWEIPGDLDEGIDLDVEFSDDNGYGTGKHMYLQLKAGNSFLKKRKNDGAEIFTIKKQRWVQYWVKQSVPMMLVIGTFPENREPGFGIERKTFADVRWMEIGAVLKNESENGKKAVKQIEFKGERLDALSVRKWRNTVLDRD